MEREAKQGGDFTLMLRPEAWIFGLSLVSMLALVLAPHRIGLGLGF